jgi:hypothetical protein
MKNNLDFELQRTFQFLGVEGFHTTWENDLKKNNYTSTLAPNIRSTIHNVISPSIEALYKLINLRIQPWELTYTKEIILQSEGIAISPESIAMLKERKIMIEN